MHPSWRRPSGISASSMSVTPDKNLAPFAPGPEGLFCEDLVPEVAQTRCSNSRHLSWTALLRSSTPCSLVYRQRHHDNFTFAFKSELSCEHLGPGANEEGHPQVDHAGEGLNDPPSCDATGYTETHNEIMRTHSTQSSVPMQNVRRRRAEQPNSFVNLRTASKRIPLVRNQLRRTIIVSCVFWQGLSQGFLREADCGVRVHLPSPVPPLLQKLSGLPVTHVALRHVILHVLFTDT